VIEKETLETDLGPIEIVRRPGRRRLSIVMQPWRPLEIRTNKKTSIKEIRNFLLEKKAWITKNLKSFESYRAAFPDKKFIQGETFPLLGRERTLVFEETTWSQFSAQFRGEKLVVYVPSRHWSQIFLMNGHPEIKPLLRELYKKVSIFHLNQRVQALSFQMQLFPADLKYNESKTLWGSCSRNGSIRLNWKVIVFSPETIDYLIIHELSHLKHLNHSAQFWDLVREHCPQFKEHKTILKKEISRARFIGKE
jgi:predicted metal-dependent hydrolase